MRFGAVFRYRKSYGAVRCCDISYGAVRRGSPFNGFFYGAARRENRTTPFFLHGAPYEYTVQTAVSCGSRAFSRVTNETAVFLLFLYSEPY